MRSSRSSQQKDLPEHSRSRSRSTRLWILLIVVGFAGASVYAYWNQASGQTARPAKPGAGSGPPSVLVVTATARQGDIGVYLTGLGSVTPLHTVTLKTRVDGELMKVLFREGQMVTKGTLLAEIDPRPFEVQLTQAEGQLARDQAQLQNARVDLERFKVLAAQDSIARQQLDTQEALVRQLEGTVKLDQGQIDSAKLQLVYARIAAPVSGRIGLRLVDPGNIVHVSDTGGLAVITQLQPITVVFTIPEDSLPAVLDKLKAGKRLAVEAYNRELTHKLATGHLLTVDNQIDPATGTVRLKAEFANQDNELFPNQFVNARLLLDVVRGTTVVPSACLQRSTQGLFVYLVKEDQTVTVRPVRIGPAEGDEVAIEEGLAVGDQVVVEGAERLREGSKVEIKSDAPASANQKGNG